MSSPYPMFAQVWPVAFLLLLMCCPSRLRTWLLTRLRWLGFAIALLLLAPYLFS